MCISFWSPTLHLFLFMASDCGLVMIFFSFPLSMCVCVYNSACAFWKWSLVPARALLLPAYLEAVQ